MDHRSLPQSWSLPWFCELMYSGVLLCLKAWQCSHALRRVLRFAGRWLSIEAPTPEDKIACLTEIAQEHGVDWAPDGAAGPPGAKAYLSGDRTSYSDPLTPPSGGWGGNSGGCLLHPCCATKRHLLSAAPSYRRLILPARSGVVGSEEAELMHAATVPPCKHSNTAKDFCVLLRPCS